MLRGTTPYRYVLLPVLLAVAGCKGSAIHVEVDGGTTTCTVAWWFAALWAVAGLVVMGSGIAALRWAKEKRWGGVMPVILGLVIFVLTLAWLNERVAVDEGHLECTSGLLSPDTHSVRFDDLRDITVESYTHRKNHFPYIGTTTEHYFICHKKSGGYEKFILTGELSKAKPQIVTNAQQKGVTLIGFEQLQD